MNSLSRYVGEPWSAVVSYAALSQHFLEFTRGHILLADVLYYLSVVAVCLFLTTRLVEKRRWE